MVVTSSLCAFAYSTIHKNVFLLHICSLVWNFPDSRHRRYLPNHPGIWEDSLLACRRLGSSRGLMHISFPDRKFSLARSTAEEPVISGSIPVVSSSSTMFTFSPPNRTVIQVGFYFFTSAGILWTHCILQVIGRPGQMDEVARALCSNTHFTFASPATYLMKKFLSSTSGASSPKSEVEKEEASIETSYRFTSTSGVEEYVCFLFYSLHLTWRFGSTNSELNCSFVFLQIVK